MKTFRRLPKAASARVARRSPALASKAPAGRRAIRRILSGNADILQRYRRASAENFGGCDGGGLAEKVFEKGDPWIEKIAVRFTSIETSGSEVMPKGTLSATYKDNARAALSGVEVLGGKASKGLTDASDVKPYSKPHKVTRIEGCGYHDRIVPTEDRPAGDRRGKHFHVDKKGQASMSLAIFFVEGKSTGNQAIHKGSLTSGSLACIHVDEDDSLRKLNYHSRRKKTQVAVSYGASTLEKICCERFKEKRTMSFNPCFGQKARECP